MPIFHESLSGRAYSFMQSPFSYTAFLQTFGVKANPTYLLYREDLQIFEDVPQKTYKSNTSQDRGL